MAGIQVTPAVLEFKDVEHGSVVGAWVTIKVCRTWMGLQTYQ